MEPKFRSDSRSPRNNVARRAGQKGRYLMGKFIRSLSVLTTMFTMVALSCLSACESTKPDNPGALGSVSLSLSLAADQCGVTKVTATVDAPDMKTLIGPVTLTIAEDKVTGTIGDIPIGTQRRVTVLALNAANLPVYKGQAFADVFKGEATAVTITLYRDYKACPNPTTVPPTGSGSLNIAGTLNNDFLAFSPVATQMDDQGVVYFLDGANHAIRRYSIDTAMFLEPLIVPAESSLMAVPPAGDNVYVAYSRNRIDAIDVATSKRTFFVATPEQVSAMAVVGSYLFTIDASGAWNSHRLYDRKSGVCKSSADWRNAAEGLVFSPLLSRVFTLTAGVSPNDVEFEPIDLEKGVLGQNKDSPYHGDFSLRGPLKLFPGENKLGLGVGDQFLLVLGRHLGEDLSGDHDFLLGVTLGERDEDRGVVRSQMAPGQGLEGCDERKAHLPTLGHPTEAMAVLQEGKLVGLQADRLVVVPTRPLDEPRLGRDPMVEVPLGFLRNDQGQNSTSFLEKHLQFKVNRAFMRPPNLEGHEP